jgi:Domain of unknown function (DUF4845)
MTGLKLLFVMIVAASALTCFFKLGPLFLDNWFIMKALKALGEQHSEDLNQLSKTTIQGELDKFYMINNIRGEGAKALKIERLKDYTVLTVAYEVRVHMIANIDAVVTFNNVLDSRNPKECCRPSEATK